MLLGALHLCPEAEFANKVDQSVRYEDEDDTKNRNLFNGNIPTLLKKFLAENRSFNFCEKHHYLHENHHPPFRSCEKKGSALGKVSSLVQDRCSLVTNVGLVE